MSQSNNTAREVQVKSGAEITVASGAQTEGMIRMNAITDMSDQLCGTGKSPIFSTSKYTEANSFYSVMVAKPHTSSAVHHHGKEGTVTTFI
jgi:hypothetical protein